MHHHDPLVSQLIEDKHVLANRLTQVYSLASELEKAVDKLSTVNSTYSSMIGSYADMVHKQRAELAEIALAVGSSDPAAAIRNLLDQNRVLHDEVRRLRTLVSC